MRKARIALMLVAALAVGTPGVANYLSAAAAPVVTSGTCTRVVQSTWLDTTLNHDPAMRYWDPIVFPGIFGYFASDDAPYNLGIHGPAHWHTFFGNRSLNPDGIQDADAPTTCTGGFRGDFWTPSLLGYNAETPNGARLDPVAITYTFRSGPAAVTPPTGLGIIARGARWDCGPGTLQGDVPMPCPQGVTPQVTLTFPKFWDGVNLHLDDEAHVSGVRDAGYPVRIPRLTVRVTFQKTYFGPATQYSVGGVPIAVGTPGFPEGGPPFKEDERSMHMDVLYP